MTTPTPETGTPDPATPPADPPSPDPEGTPETGDLQAQLAAALADAEKWKNHSRTNEDKAKANKAELDRIRREGMTPDEKALDEAREQARAEVLKSVAADRAEDAIRLAFHGRDIDVEELIKGVDAAKFVDDTGEPDRGAIKAWAELVAPAASPLPPDLGQGARPQAPALNSTQLERDLKSALGIR